MQKELPSWVLPLAIVVGVVVVGFIVWRGIAGYAAPVGQDIAVHPGMYNMRAEMQKPRHSNPPGTRTEANSPPAATTP